MFDFQQIDLSPGDLLYYGGVEWLNISDFLGKIKKGLELHAMCFVFKTAVVFLCKERLRQKKKSLIVRWFFNLSLYKADHDYYMINFIYSWYNSANISQKVFTKAFPINRLKLRIVNVLYTTSSSFWIGANETKLLW